MKKYIILMQMWLACVLLMTACSDLDEQVEQLVAEKEEIAETDEMDDSSLETKAVKYYNVQTIALTTHGTLKEQLGDNLTTTDKLILSGPIDATDVDVFRNQMTALKAIDMTDVTFVESDSTYTYNSRYGYTASLKYGVIPEAMFKGLDNFVEIKLPKEVTQLEGSTFSGCSSLQTIELPENLETFGSGSGNYPFSGCSSLISIVIPEKIEVIPFMCFYSCSSLKSVILPQNLLGIEGQAFRDCSALSSIELPEKLTYVDGWAFYYCELLESITIPASVTTWGNEVFYNCDKLSSVALEEGLTVLGKSMFYGCDALKQIKIPSSIKELPYGLFYECYALEKVSLNSGLEKIGSSAFYGCTSLSTIELPETLVEIGNYAFKECSFAVIDFLPNSLTKIGDSAFSQIDELTTAILPDNVETLGLAVFSGCSNLKDVTLPKNLTNLSSSIFSGTAIETITLPETLTTLGERLFYDCRSLKEIKIPELVTVIPEDCFYNCSSLVSVTLPDGITNIEGYAFSGCSGLTNIKLPASLTTLGKSAFRDTALTEILFPAGLNEIAESTCSRCQALERVVISEGTTKIGSYAFEEAKKLTEATITLPSTLKEIGSYAFEDVEGITSLSFLPDGLEKIGSYAFSGCSIKDKVITLPSITSIGNYAFKNNKTIGAIYINGSQDVVLDDIFGKPSNCLIYATGHVTFSSDNLHNKVTNGNCLKLRLVENSPWYCPEPFNAGIVTLTKQFNQRYSSTSSPSYAVSGKASNWYAINMPFVPTEITSADGRTWAPFNAGVEGAKPFWLRKLTTDTKKSFADVTEIEADVPYIISFPCNESYEAEYNLCGDVTFTGTNVSVPKTEGQTVVNGPYYAMYSNYENIPKASSIYLLNSAHYNPDGVKRNSSDIWGSAFEQSLRESWSWEPYISFSSPTTTRTISLDGASTRGHKEVGSIPSIDDM